MNLDAQSEPTKQRDHDSGSRDDSAELTVTLSRSLLKKLVSKAEAERIPVSDFACELLAEGLVLRAWEIMERKSTLKAAHSNHAGGGGRSSGRGGNRGSGNHGYPRRGGGPSGGRRGGHRAILEDSANFLEYVRAQEKRQR